MLHSKVAMFSSAQAERTMFTARTSSEVSITTIGVEELIKTFRRSRPSLMFETALLGIACDRQSSFARRTAPSAPLRASEGGCPPHSLQRFDRSRVAAL